MANLVKAEIVLQDQGWQAPYRWFTDDEQNARVGLTGEDWFDMGKPQQITVTIQPGDRLNDDEVVVYSIAGGEG